MSGALLLLLAGCAAPEPVSLAAPAPDTHEEDAPFTAAPVPDEPAAAGPGETPGSKTALFERDYIRIELPVYDGWDYEIRDGDHPGIRFWKEGSRDRYAELLFYPMFGVCGTGLEEKDADFPAGREAKIGYYDGHPDWDFVCFCNAPGDYAATNCGLIGSRADEALAMLGQATLGCGGIGSKEAAAIAETAAAHDYYTHPLFDGETGRWTVKLWETGGSLPVVTVTLEADGTVVSRDYAE